MKYNEKDELEATGEWLLRINDVGFAEELTYVPSYLSKVGIAPVDVVDRLDWLRSRGSIKTSAVVGTAPVLVLERSRVEEVAEVVVVAEVAEICPPEESTSVFDCDTLAPWEWFDPMAVIEDTFKYVFDPEPGLHVFNNLASLMRSTTRRGRGKRARSSVKYIA